MRKATVGMDGVAYEQAALEAYMEACAEGACVVDGVNEFVIY